MQAIDPGFDTEQVLTARVSLDFTAFNDMAEMHDYLKALVIAVGDTPLVRTAALTQKPPYRQTNPNLSDFIIQGRAIEETQTRPQLDRNVVTPEYFEVLGIPLLSGRLFDSRDEPTAAPVAVINQTLARQYWADEDPIGARVSFDDGETWTTIVGVAGDTRIYGPETPVTSEFYRPFGQAGMPTWLMLRTVGDPVGAAQGVKDAAYALGANPISDLQPMAVLRADAVASPRLTASLLGIFGVLALIVTGTGIAGVMAFSITQRTREMGLRMALGAQRQSILTMVIRQGMVQVVVGLAFGIAGAFAFGRVLRELLFEIQPSDPLTFAIVLVALSTAALVAIVIPASPGWRSARAPELPGCRRLRPHRLVRRHSTQRSSAPTRGPTAA